MEEQHKAVFLKEAIDALSIERGDTVVDATVGGAGHFAKMLHALDSTGTLVGIDADGDSLVRARKITNDLGVHVELIEENFRNLAYILDKLHITKIDKSLFDLGWSSFQLTSNRGFSFQKDEPLLMTYCKNSMHTVAELVNSAPEEKLSDILYTLGEERFARQIARSIVQERHNKRILTTFELVSAVMNGTPVWYQHRRVHPATKTFQALRIAINDELGAIREGLTVALERTRPGGHIAVITFHSIEDRIVKMLFRDAASVGRGTVLTRKPVVPSVEEIAANHRARSAKLRVFVCAPIPAREPICHSNQHLYA